MQYYLLMLINICRAYCTFTFISLPPFMTVLCVITEGGGRVGETDRLCFERFELCHSLKKKTIYYAL